ncbi:MAG: flagellar biosynthetic protein FliO [Planctomycetota bacterium]
MGSSALLESVSPDGGPRIPLVTQKRSSEGRDAGTPGRPNGLSPLITISGSLGVVLGLFLLVAWVMQRAVPGGSVLLPKEVVEVLGRAALAGRGQVHLLRCGSKLLLVCVSPTGIETLTEITDPDEVNRLAGLCGQGRPGSTTAAFRQVFQQFAQERSVPEMPGASDDVRLANAGISRRTGRVLEDHDV